MTPEETIEKRVNKLKCAVCGKKTWPIQECHCPERDYETGDWNERENYFANKARTTLLAELIEEVEKVKEAVQTTQGTNKYDSCYDDCINILKSKQK